MFVHPELLHREQQRGHAQLIAELELARQAKAAPSPHHRLRTTVRRARIYLSSRRSWYRLTALLTGHRHPDPEPAVPRQAEPTTHHGTPPDTAQLTAGSPVTGRAFVPDPGVRPTPRER